MKIKISSYRCVKLSIGVESDPEDKREESQCLEEIHRCHVRKELILEEIKDSSDEPNETSLQSFREYLLLNE